MKRLLLLIIPILIWGHGSSLKFDGVDDSINCGTGASLNITGAVTVSAWVKPLVNNAWSGVVVKGTDDAFQLLARNDGYWGWYIKSSGGVGANMYNTQTIILNTWQHIVGVFDPLAGKVFLYKNGVSSQLATLAIDIASVISPLCVGRYANFYFNGYVGKVHIYKRALDQSEILWLYNHPEKIYSTDSLKLWLPLSEYTGTVAGDSSGNANNGTISGAVWNIDTPVAGGICPKP
jgi:hypothetical protein